MAVLVFAESSEGICKKAAFEAVTYARKSADLLDQSCIALTLGSPENAADLGKYGAEKVLDVPMSELSHFDGQIYAKLIAEVAQEVDAGIVILSHTSTGKSIAGSIAIRLDAGLVSAVSTLPEVGQDLRVRRLVFSGKAIAHYELTSTRKVLSLATNAFPPEEIGSTVTVESLSKSVGNSVLVQKEIKKQSGSVALPEAELVVSGGRGFKGPENWSILEELAGTLGAATACSRPVADSGWRPHHEHVGQTGVAISPNLYIAIGISGAIQHLGGVNNSKTIVVVNKDPEAPFFKAADYGVVGDLFDVIPALTEAIKRHKTS